MKKSAKIVNTGKKNVYEQLTFKDSASTYEEYAKVIKAISEYRCKDILDSEEGHILPANMGRIIILGDKPRVKQVYSVTRPGVKIYNINTFGYIYRICHKDTIVMRYPKLFRYRAHRLNLKKPLKYILDNHLKTYFKQHYLR